MATGRAAKKAPPREKQAATRKKARLSLSPTAQPQAPPREDAPHTRTSRTILDFVQPATVAAAHASNVSRPQPQPQPPAALWSAAADPTSEDDLAVAKKKLDEIRGWLSARPETLRAARVMVLTGTGPHRTQSQSSTHRFPGPPGCGKRCTINVLARAAGYTPQYWQAPLPTSYAEHRYINTAAVGYTSKVAAFEEYAARAKMGCLALQPTSAAAAVPPPTPLMVVHDLPFAHSSEAKQRIVDAVDALVASSQGPVVLLHTVGSAGEQRDRRQGDVTAEVADGLATGGAFVMSLNPVTTAATKRTLQRVAAQHGLPIAAEDADAVAHAAGGDLRSAIGSLQLLLIGRRSKGGRPRSRARPKALGLGAEGKSLFGKDDSLSLFHSLGKILYNKRVEPNSNNTMDPNSEDSQRSLPPSSQQTPSRRRLLLSPEDVLHKAALPPTLALAFLHEHHPRFAADDFVEEAAGVAGYMSDADILCAFWGVLDDSTETGDTTQTSMTNDIAGSVGARGFMWCNQHAPPRTFLALDAPAAFTVQRAVEANQQQLAFVARQTSTSLLGLREWAAELLPMAKRMCGLGPVPAALALLPPHWSTVFEKQVVTHQPHAAAAAMMPQQETEPHEDYDDDDDAIEESE